MNISASVFAADPLNIEHSLHLVLNEIESLHFDVMDGQYTRAYGLNERMFIQLKKFTDKPIDVHLMVIDPIYWAERFSALGARWVAFHPEVCCDPMQVINSIRNNGSLAYIALSLDVKPEAYTDLINEADGVLILSAPAGGGDFSIDALAKANAIPYGTPLAYDGKIKPEIFPNLRKNKKDLAIMGTAMWSKF